MKKRNENTLGEWGWFSPLNIVDFFHCPFLGFYFFPSGLEPPHQPHQHFLFNIPFLTLTPKKPCHQDRTTLFHLWAFAKVRWIGIYWICVFLCLFDFFFFCSPPSSNYLIVISEHKITNYFLYFRSTPTRNCMKFYSIIYIFSNQCFFLTQWAL